MVDGGLVEKEEAAIAAVYMWRCPPTPLCRGAALSSFV